MNPILEMLMNSAGGGAGAQLGQKFGLSPEQTSGALAQLVPSVMAGIQRNTQQEGGLDALIGALSGGKHAQYIDQPELLGQQATIDDGNSILGHVFGTKDVSRAVAARAAEKTGIGSDILKAMLPMVATMVMGGLAKQGMGGALTGALGSALSGGGLGGALTGALTGGLGGGAGMAANAGGGLLTSLLDQDKDGSVVDDLAGIFGKFLSR
jgi:hypothetical protein